MKNWKTTVSGILGGLGVLFPMLGLPAEVGQAISIIGIFLMGVFAKDHNVTGA